MFGTKILIDKLNTAINSGSLTELQIVQALGAIESLEKHPVSSVLTSTDLPNPVTNKGRFFWIENELKYTFSNGITWDIDSIIIEPYVNVWTWGINTDGKLGDGTLTAKSSPVSILGGFTDWIGVSTGTGHVIGLRANGTAWGWGLNSSGQIGDNSSVSRLSPVSVVGGFADWVQLSAGISHSVGVRANGTAWAWGQNARGQLGDDTTAAKSSPVSVVGGFADWVQLVTGAGAHTLGIRANGTAWAWGYNPNGQLGNGNTTSFSSPVAVVGGFTDWVQLSIGQFHSLGVRANGTAWAWGINTQGRLGDGTTVAKSSPVSVVGGFTDWVQVSGGGNTHSIGLRANGTAWSWGSNVQGRLGDGTAVASKTSPGSVVGGFTDWVQVSAGSAHNLALRANGTAWAWGYNTQGPLGDGSTTSSSSPVSVIGGFTDWVQISAGSGSSAALRG